MSVDMSSPPEDVFSYYDRLFESLPKNYVDETPESLQNYNNRKTVYDVLKTVWGFFKKKCQEKLNKKSTKKDVELEEDIESEENVELEEDRQTKMSRYNSLCCSDSQYRADNCIISTFTNAIMTLILDLVNIQLSGKYNTLIDCINNISKPLLSNSIYMFYLLLLESFSKKET
jgi:hypothetical protein